MKKEALMIIYVLIGTITGLKVLLTILLTICFPIFFGFVGKIDLLYFLPHL